MLAIPAECHIFVTHLQVIENIMENYWSQLEHVEYVDTFKMLKAKHDQNQDRVHNQPQTSAQIAGEKHCIPMRTQA